MFAAPLSCPPFRPRPSAARRSLGALGIVALLAVGASLLSPVAHGAEKKKEEQAEEEIDYLSLAARLLKDGHYDRAEITLREIDPKKDPELDLARYHTLRGLVFLKLQRLPDARDAFVAAIEAGSTEKTLYLHLAQVHYELKDYAATITALNEAGRVAIELPGAHLIRAQCFWELGEHGKALGTLAAAQQRFPNEADFARRRFFYLVDLKLFQEALDLGQGFLRRKGATEDDYAAVGEALRQAAQYEKAEEVLEGARLQFPESERLTLLLAHTYLAHERVLTAAMLFEEAALRNPVHALEAAELYRRAKRYDRAMYLNARVLDQKAKMKQRMSILLQMERFESVTAMAPTASRLGLLEEDDIRYALAYAYFKTGDFTSAERELKPIRSAELFNSANELRKLMQSCHQAGWECM